MLILENLPAEQAQDFLSRSWVPQNFHMYYSAKEISRQCTEDFTADITERASSEFGAGYRDHISPLLQDQFNYMPTQDTRDWANRFFSITDSRHIPSAYRNSIPWARSESTFYRCNSYEYSLYYSLYRSSKPIFASPL